MMATVEYVQVAYISSYDLRERLLMIEAGSDASHAQYVSGHGHHAGYTRLTGPITNVPVKFKSKKALHFFLVNKTNVYLPGEKVCPLDFM